MLTPKIKHLEENRLSSPEFKKPNLNDYENKIIKEYNLTIDDTISPRQEKTFRSLELTGANNIDFTYVNILIKEGKRPLKDNKNQP